MNAKNFFEVLDNALYQLDEPVGDPGLIPQYLVNKEISQYAKIVYSGQGFDELFFGYARNLAAYSIAKFGKNSFSLKNSSLPEEITNLFPGVHEKADIFLSALMTPTFETLGFFISAML